MYQEIEYKVDDPVAKVTLNRPERLNAWTERMGQEVQHAVAQAEQDPRVVVLVLTGSGRGFCAGADVQALSSLAQGGSVEGTADEALSADPGDRQMGAAYRGRYTYFMSVKKPVIAAINGPCAGLALPVVLSCDLRFASDRAVFTTAFSRRGLIAEWGISWMLPRLIGPARALDLLFSARKVDAREAERLGLVDRVVPHDSLLKEVRTYAEELAQHCSPASMMVMKRQVYLDLARSLDASHDEAVKEMVESFQRPDFAEGVQSFIEKRPPRFARVKG